MRVTFYLLILVGVSSVTEQSYPIFWKVFPDNRLHWYWQAVCSLHLSMVTC